MVLHLDWVADPAESEAGELPENFILEDLAWTLLCHMVVRDCDEWESCDPPPPQVKRMGKLYLIFTNCSSLESGPSTSTGSSVELALKG